MNRARLIIILRWIAVIVATLMLYVEIDAHRQARIELEQMRGDSLRSMR